MCNMFRTLQADEIEVRVGNTNKAKTKANLLLYKDARCDQNILDEAVGPYNWQRSHSRDNANCTVSIWDEKKEQWISKEDTGTESKTEAEKGLASDSFKRACFNWGIGRELYSAPQIWVNYDPENDKFKKFKVLEIGYDDKRQINALSIMDEKSGVVVFKFGKATMNHAPIQPANLLEEEIPIPTAKAEPQQSQQIDAWKVSHQDMNKKPWNPIESASTWVKNHGITMATFGSLRNALVSGGVVKEIPLKDMDAVDLQVLYDAIISNYADQLKVTA